MMASPWDTESDALGAAAKGKQPAPDVTIPKATEGPDHATEIAASLANPAAAPPAPQSWGSYLSDVGQNFNTSVQKGFSSIAGFPHTVAQLGDRAMDLFAQPRNNLLDVAAGGQPAPSSQPAPPPLMAPGPGWLTRHTYSPDEITNAAFEARNKAFPDLPPVQPYVPQTLLGKVGSEAVQGGITGLLGGPEGALARVGAGAGGSAAGEAYKAYRPDASPWELMLANVLGGGTTLGLTRLGEAGINAGRNLLSHSAAEEAARRTVATRLADASGQTAGQLVSTMDLNAPQWTAGTRPDLGNLTESPGIRGMVYKDMTAAAREGDPVYEQMGSTTNQAQRTAIAGARPADADARLAQAVTDRDTAVAAIPPGLSQQDAGAQFRQNLQGVYDQRTAARAEGGDMFAALQNNPAQVNLLPVRDYATEMAARNAGEVGSAYQRAGQQLRSATGLTLDTADFANSARQALGDLAASYPRGSASARAVLDVKNQLESSLTEQVPEVGEAVTRWRQNSQPLDVFKAEPFGGVLARDRFNQRYLMPNDQVASSFLRGKGSADAMDRLTQVFGDPETASRSLQDYIAGQVRTRAVNPDGSINQAALRTVLQPYDAALMRFPTLRRQFATADGAQTALDQQQNYQRLYNTVENELGTQKTDTAGSQFYSPAKVDKFVRDNAALIDQAYTPEQAAAVRRVNIELQNMAQTAQSRVAGTSGTAQLIQAVGPHGATIGSAVGGTVLGWLGGHLMGLGGEAGALAGGSLSAAMAAAHGRQAALLSQVQRQALTDPTYARSLLMQFDASGVSTPAAQRALQYVLQRTPIATLAGQAGQ